MINRHFKNWRKKVREWPVRIAARVSRTRGTTDQSSTQTPDLVVSLTTIANRMSRIHITLQTLLAQSVRPHRLILWVTTPVEECMTPALHRLTQRGLEIRYHPDIGPLTKYVPTRKLCPNALIVTADDDIIYPRFWLAELYQAYLNEPQFIHAHRAHEMTFEQGKLMPYADWNWEARGVTGPSHQLFPTGVGGVLYAPGHLHPDVLDIQRYQKLTPTADDIWLKVMAWRQGTPARKVRPHPIDLPEVSIGNNVRLGVTNYYQGGNDKQLAAVTEFYKIDFSNDPPA